MAKRKYNKKEVEAFKKQLLELKAEYLHDIKNMAQNPNSGDSDSRDMSGHVLHMADVATDMYEKEFNMGLASHEREVLVKIDEALDRIDKGVYGICLGTGELILKARLEAIPYAEYTREHQEKLEEEGEI